MKYKIVHATEEDLPEILHMAEDFINHVNNPVATWDEDVMVYRMLQLIKDYFFIVAKDENGDIVGGLGAVITPAFWSRTLIAEEVFWWVDPAYHRTRAGAILLNYFMTETKKAGLKPILHLLHDSPISPESLKRHHGLVQKESTFYLET